MAKYIKCRHCGKKIYFGEDVYTYDGYQGMFCSAECFADVYAEIRELEEDDADNCCMTIFDDDVRKAEIFNEIVEHQKVIDDRQEIISKLLREYELL